MQAICELQNRQRSLYRTPVYDNKQRFECYIPTPHRSLHFQDGRGRDDDARDDDARDDDAHALHLR